MATTFEALMSREVPNTLASNLVSKGETLASLKKKSDQELVLLGLSHEHIASIKDGARSQMPVGVVRKVLEECRHTCCICRHPGRPYVIHHIEEWGRGGTHEEDNLAVLCLEDHDRAHSHSSLSRNLTPEIIKSSRKRWVKQAAKIERNRQAMLAQPYHRGVRWYWVHLDNLRALTTRTPKQLLHLGQDWLLRLRENGLIDNDGNVNPSSSWKEGKNERDKMYVFDSGNAQDLAIYVSDLIGLWIRGAAVLDINDMLDSPRVLRNYLEVGSWVYVRSKFSVNFDRDAKDFQRDVIDAVCERTEVCIKYSFNAWTSMNQSSRGGHLRRNAERSVVGQVSDISMIDDKLHIEMSPLGISPDFVLHDPSQGDWVEGQKNDGYKRRRKLADD